MDTRVLHQQSGVLSTNKLIRNTYMLLSMTLVFSAIMAAVSIAVGTGFGLALVLNIAAIVMLWFVLPRVANSSMALPVTFGITGMLGFGLGPLLTHYLALPNGGQLVMMAMGGTGGIFLGLSGYALTSRKDFSFIGGFLMAGMMVAMLAGIGAMLFSIPALALGVSAMVVLLMSGLILWQTSLMVNGGETNYVMATVNLYLSILNLFTSLLHLLGVLGDD